MKRVFVGCVEELMVVVLDCRWKKRMKTVDDAMAGLYNFREHSREDIILN